MRPTPAIRLRLPPVIRKNEPFEVRAMVMHPMDNGYRYNSQGTIYPIHIIQSFACDFEGTPLFKAQFSTGISANPYLSFRIRLPRSGTLTFTWLDQDGSRYRRAIPVTLT